MGWMEGWGYDHNGLIARPKGAPKVGMVDKAEPISLSGLGYAQSGLGRDQSGLGRDQSGLGRDQSNHGHNLASCSCGHESNNHATRQTKEFRGHWLWHDWALMWHHTENHDQATTTVVGYPDSYYWVPRKVTQW